MTRHTGQQGCVALLTSSALARSHSSGSTTTYSLLRRGSLSRRHDGDADGVGTA